MSCEEEEIFFRIQKKERERKRDTSKRKVVQIADRFPKMIPVEARIASWRYDGRED